MNARNRAKQAVGFARAARRAGNKQEEIRALCAWLFWRRLAGTQKIRYVVRPLAKCA